ncbi:MAG: glycosyltransferase 87 family protein [Pseudomonadota bacterium]
MDTDRSRWHGRIQPQLWGRLAYLAFWAAAIFLALRWCDQAIPRYLPKDWSSAHEFDGLVDWKAARLYLAGGSPFSPAGLAELHVASFGHPPTTPFWFIPLARFDKPIAAELIDLCSWFMLVVHLYICASAVKFPAPAALTVLLFSWALTTEGFVMHWHAIQLSEQIAFPIVVCWAYLRRAKQMPAGLSLGIAATFKLFPGVLMVFLLFARRFRAFFAASAVFVCIAAAMTKTFGIECWKLFLMQQGPVSREWMGSVRNGSLHGIVLRLFFPICKAESYPTATTSYVATAISILLLVLAGLVARRNVRLAREQDPRNIDQPYALFTVVAVFVNPWIWEHYWVFMIQPAFVVGSEFWRLFRATWAAWLEERVSSSTLAVASIWLLFAGLGLGAVVKLLGTQDIRTERLRELWFATKSPWAHRQMHMHEIFNWLPWVIMISLCMLCAIVQPRLERLRSGGVHTR